MSEEQSKYNGNGGNLIAHFHIHCVPPKATAQSGSRIMKRQDGRMFIGRMSNTPAAAAKRDLLSLFAENAPECPTIGCLRVAAVLTFPYRKNEPKRNLARPMPMPVRPDVDNLAKMILDSLTTLGYWSDDSQVTDLRIRKQWGHKIGITLTIERDE